MHRKRAWAIFAAGLSVFAGLCTTGRAHANGRYPYSQQFLVDPSDSARLWLRSTYGILTSPNAGKTWSWICESAVGYRGSEDPMMAVLSDGTALAAAPEGLFATRDHGCTWIADPDIGARAVTDIATETDAAHVFALTEELQGNGDRNAVVWRSDDVGKTWTALGPPISKDVETLTLDPAPSDPSRIYVTGATVPASFDAGSFRDAGSDGSAPSTPPSQSVLLRSTNGGATWERRIIPGTSPGDQALLAGVDPVNPDAVYVRVRGSWDGTNPVQSYLLYSSDAGDTWHEVLRKPADMLGFALLPGGDVVVGFGDTYDFQRPVDRSVIGMYRGRAPTFAFVREFSGQVGCLTDSAKGLYMCGTHESDGFEVGLASDSGTTATKVLDYPKIDGPLACAKDSIVTSQCGLEWPFVCVSFGTCADGPDGGRSTPTKSGGCGCGSPGSQSSGDQVGTARLEMIPDWALALGVTSMVAARLTRRFRRRRK